MFDNILHKGKEIFNWLLEKVENKNEKESENKELGILDNVIAETITDRQRNILERLSRGHKTQASIKERATIILDSKETSNISHIALKNDVIRTTVRRWKERWIINQKRLNKIELEEPHKLKRAIISILSDANRSGKPPKFKSEQIATIVFISLQDPAILDVPISHWTAASLRRKTIELKIVENISERQITRYLKNLDIKVHRYKEWLNSLKKNPDLDEYKERINTICDTYKNSEKLEIEGIIVTSTDEKTSIQAIEHIVAAKKVIPGSVEKIESEYKRNGTTTLTATRDINTGKIIEPMIQATRNEKDFEQHILNVINTNPGSKRVMIMDQLNTHMSESMVILFAEICNIPRESLGVKGKKGILKSMESRKKFLEDPTHPIRVLFTPKHASWLNQIEIWFGILTRQLLNRRYSFKSVEELEQKIREYIDFYNKYLAKKFNWSYSGKA
jgi:transposase